MRGLPQKQNARRADKIRLCGHLGRYKKIVKKTYIICYKIIYESGETYDRRRNELSVEISKEDYKKIITGVLQERSIDQIE